MSDPASSHGYLDKEDYVEEEGWCPHYSILDVFSPEVLFLLLSYLDWFDLCTVAQTCTYLHEMCTNRVLWTKLQRLDFTRCRNPTVERILVTAAKCSGALSLSVDLPLNDEQVLQILRHCPRLRRFNFKNGTAMTNSSMFAVACKCVGVTSVKLCEASAIDVTGLAELLENQPDLVELKLKLCNSLAYLELKHPNPNYALKLTRVTLKKMIFDEHGLSVLCASCPVLQHLNLSGSTLTQFTMEEVEDGLGWLTYLDLSACKFLHGVELIGLSELVEVNVSQCMSLVHLFLECVSVSSLNVAECKKLNHISVESDELKVMDFSSLDRLTEFNLSCPHLTSLNLAYAHRLPYQVILSHLHSLQNLGEINVTGCNQLDEKVLEMLIGAATCAQLHLGAITIPSLSFASSSIEHLVLRELRDLVLVGFKSPSLHELHVEDCLDIEEEPFVEGLLYGTKLRKTLGFTRPMPVLSGSLGAQNLTKLCLVRVPNVCGKGISELGGLLPSLQVLMIDKCQFLKELCVDGWAGIETVSVFSCPQLSVFIACACPQLGSVTLEYCGTLERAIIEEESLSLVSTKGTSFQQFSLSSLNVRDIHLNSIMISVTSTFQLNCPNLNRLFFCKCSQLTGKQVNDTVALCPFLESLTIEGSAHLREIIVTSSIVSLVLIGLRRLNSILMDANTHLHTICLSGLPKLPTSVRDMLLASSSSYLQHLKLTGLPRSPSSIFEFPKMESLQVDQFIQMKEIHIVCPQLAQFSLQGVPNLKSLYLEVNQLEQLQVQSRSCTVPSLCHLHLVCHKARFLARILDHYCPHLETLTLTQAVITLLRLKSAVNTLTWLKSIHLNQCVLETSECGDSATASITAGADSFLIERRLEGRPVMITLNDTQVEYIDC